MPRKDEYGYQDSITTGKCFNPYCNLPGSNWEILIVSKLFVLEHAIDLHLSILSDSPMLHD